MLRLFLVEVIEYVARISARLVTGHLWLVKVGVVSSLITMFFAFPSYDVVLSSGLQGKTWNAVEAKSRDLTFNVLDLGEFGPGNNAARVNYRLTVPAVASVLGLTRFGIFALQSLLGIGLLMLSAMLAEKITDSRVIALWMAILVGGLQAGQTGFGELRGLFDGVALVCVLLAAVVPSRPVVALCVFGAAWTDERGIVAGGGLVLLFVFRRLVAADRSTFFAACATPENLSVGLGLVAYALTRLWLASTMNIPAALGGIDPLLPLQLYNQIPLGIMFTFKTGWLFVFFATVCLIRTREIPFLVCLLTMIGTSLVTAFMVEDISRSTSFLLPYLFVCLFVISRIETADSMPRWTIAISAATILMPTYYIGSATSVWLYPLPVQLLRWTLLSQGLAST